nr:unnamed protein product [Leishmania braziliensis]
MPTDFHHQHKAEGRSGDESSVNNKGGGYGAPSTQHATTTHSTKVGGWRTGAGGAGVTAQQLRRFDVLLHRSENRECFDCATKHPRWASTNLGVFLCLRCAGIHRSMGTHISKVKSTNMDAWADSMMFLMEHVGNARGRLLYEYEMPPLARVTGTTDGTVVEKVIRSKYERKLYYHPSFTELFAQFMETPIEEVNGDGTGTLPPPGGNSPPPQLDTRGQAQQQHVVLEELWGAPVSSPSTNQPCQKVTQGVMGAQTSITELFSHAYPTHPTCVSSVMVNGGTNPRPTAWGNMGAPLSSVPPMSANSDLGWFDAQFGGAGSSLLGPTSGGVQGEAPLAKKPDSPSNVSTACGNVEDLFTGSCSSHTKNEILSLFDSAPVTGAYEQTSSSMKAHTGRYPMAWQPQEVKSHSPAK